MGAIVYFDRPPASGDWHVLAIMRRGRRGWDWVALLVDADPDDKSALLTAQERWVLVPGRHRSYDAACDAFGETLTRLEAAENRRATFAIVSKD